MSTTSVSPFQDFLEPNSTAYVLDSFMEPRAQKPPIPKPREISETPPQSLSKRVWAALWVQHPPLGRGGEHLKLLTFRFPDRKGFVSRGLGVVTGKYLGEREGYVAGSAMQ